MKRLLVLTLALLSACSSNAPEGARPRVVAAFYPVALAARTIAGSSVDVVDITPPGAEPHDIELTPSALDNINRAALILYLGHGFQPAVDDAVSSLSDRSRAVSVLDGVTLKGGFVEEPGEEPTTDPHVWLDPVLMGSLVQNVGDALVASLDDDDALRAKTATLKEGLASLDAEFKAGLAHCARRELVTSHAAFAYLAARYGLTQIAITGVSPEAEPSPRRLAEVAQLARDRKVTTIFFETLVSKRVSETIARQVGAKTDVLNPIEGLTPAQQKAGADYFSLMRDNLHALQRALGCTG